MIKYCVITYIFFILGILVGKADHRTQPSIPKVEHRSKTDIPEKVYVDNTPILYKL